MSSALKYGLDDLQEVLKERNYQEVLKHGADVEPANRTDEWKTVITAALIGYGSDWVSGNQRFAGETYAEALADIKSFEVTKNSTDFDVEIGTLYLVGSFRYIQDLQSALPFYKSLDKKLLSEIETKVLATTPENVWFGTGSGRDDDRWKKWDEIITKDLKPLFPEICKTAQKELEEFVDYATSNKNPSFCSLHEDGWLIGKKKNT